MGRLGAANFTLNMTDKNDSVIVPTQNGNFIEPPPMRWILRLIFIVVFIVGIVGNSVVCVAVIRRKRMRTSNNIFTFNLALCDLLIVVVFLPTQMAAFENNQNWALGNFMCRFVYTLVPVCFSASIGTLLAITCDRYRAIAYPLKPRLSGRKVKIILAIIWSGSLAICFPLIIVAGLVRPAPGQVFCDEPFWPGEIYLEVYWNFIFVIQYFLPLAIIAVLAILMAVKIRKNNAIQLLPKCSQVVVSAVKQRMKQTSKITNMLIALVILYAICMLPQHLVFLWLTYGDLGSSKYRVYVLRFGNVFPMANSALNPIVYGTLNKEFKKVFKSFFNCECCKTDADFPKVRGNHKTINRSGKFRLAMYKHASTDPDSSSEHEKRRTSSTSSLGSFITRKRLQRKLAKNDYQTANDQEIVPNGNAGLSTIVTTSSFISTGDKDFGDFLRDQKGLCANVLENVPKEQLKLYTRPPVLRRPKEEEGLLLNGRDKYERRRNGSTPVSEELGQPTSQNVKKIANRAISQCDTNIYDEQPNTSTLYSKESLERELMTSDFQDDPFIDCWVEVNKLDKKLLAYITALKETDI